MGTISPIWSHESRFFAEPSSASRARAFVSRHLTEHGRAYLVESARLVVTELAANAMTHAQTPFTVTLSESDDLVRLAVEDGSSRAPVRVVAHEQDTSGRGLSIVATMSQDWGFTLHPAGRKTVWASFPSLPGG